MPKEIWEECNSLYHYTNLEAVKSILKTQSLHATHYTCLNDYTEFRVLKPRFTELVRKIVEAATQELQREDPDVLEKNKEGLSIDEYVDYQTNTIASAFYKITLGENEREPFINPYIVSFCYHTGSYEQQNGLLSQWRAYGQSTGCAIVFDTKKLTALMTAESNAFKYDPLRLDKVIYDKEENNFEDLFPNLSTLLQETIPNMIINGKIPDISAIYGLFVHAISMYKHEGFHEEAEVRLVAPPLTKADMERIKEAKPHGSDEQSMLGSLKENHSRENGNSFIKLFETINDPSLPIIQIIVGPGLERERYLTELQELVGESKIKITCSATPFY